MTMRNLILAGSGLALSLSFSGAALADAVIATAVLDGAGETKGGDPDGSGSFSAEIDIETGDVCYMLSVDDIGSVSAAHIHKGAAGKDGKPVTAIDVTGPDDDLCIALEPTTLEEIIAAPANYYVNVHTADFPAGAIRGQLAVEGAESAADATPDAAADDSGDDMGAEEAPADEAAAE